MGEKEGPEKEIQALRRDLQDLRGQIAELVGAVRRETQPSAGRLKTFVQAFDEAMEGGVPRGHVVLVAGPSGALKTTFCAQMVARHRQAGTPGLYLSLEEPKESLIRTLQRLGLPAEGDFIVDVARMRLEQPAAHDTRDWFAILRDYLARRIAKEPVGVVVIDPLNSLYALSALPNPRRELFEFFAFLRGLSVTSFLVCETTGNEVAFANQEEFLADGTITLSFATTNGAVDLLLRCAKMRHTLHSRDPFRLAVNGGKLVASRPGPPLE